MRCTRSIGPCGSGAGAGEQLARHHRGGVRPRLHRCGGRPRLPGEARRVVERRPQIHQRRFPRDDRAVGRGELATPGADRPSWRRATGSGNWGRSSCAPTWRSSGYSWTSPARRTRNCGGKCRSRTWRSWGSKRRTRSYGRVWPNSNDVTGGGMTDHPTHVYCPRCGCEKPTLPTQHRAGARYDGNLRCVSCREPFPGAEVEAAREGALSPDERRRAERVKARLGWGRYDEQKGGRSERERRPPRPRRRPRPPRARRAIAAGRNVGGR
jgi:hypothetical protein